MFENEKDQEWLLWRFSMLDDILSETRAFQEIERKGMEKGLKEGLKEGLATGRAEGELQAQRQTILDIVWERFPELIHLAREQVEATSDAEFLRRLTVKISLAPTLKEVEQYLLALTRDDKRN
jgi:flagellar biosynthesis/type III secretory pathway protein FliH